MGLSQSAVAPLYFGAPQKLGGRLHFTGGLIDFLKNSCIIYFVIRKTYGLVFKGECALAFTLGNKTYKNAALAPMAGFSDRGMRAVCTEYGASLSVTEMISAKAVVFGDKKTFSLAAIRADEGDAMLQIFGSDPSVMAEAAAKLENGAGDNYKAPVAIDINMGCPVHKIFSNGEGSALMRNPSLIHDIVKSVSRAIAIPVCVKIRAGVDGDHINAVECALAAEEGGAALVTVHGRTRVQMYSGAADRGIIKAVKDAVSIPVLANGDVIDSTSAMEMLAATGADGIMIGRGAIGNPFIFEHIKARLEGMPEREIPFSERREVALRQLSISAEEKGEYCAVVEARKQIALYFKGFRGSAALRAEINAALTVDEVIAAIDKCARDMV